MACPERARDEEPNRSEAREGRAEAVEGRAEVGDEAEGRGW